MQCANYKIAIISAFRNACLAIGLTLLPSKNVGQPNNSLGTLFVCSGLDPFTDQLASCERRESGYFIVQPCVKLGMKNMSQHEMFLEEGYLTFFEQLSCMSYGHNSLGFLSRSMLTLICDLLKLSPNEIQIGLNQSTKQYADAFHQFGIPAKNITTTTSNEVLSADGGKLEGGVIQVNLPFPKNNPSGLLEICDFGVLRYDKIELIDFGASIERLAMVAQNLSSLSLLEDIRPIEEALAKIEFPLERLRVGSDHVRTVAYLVASGIRPDNKMRGYALRSLLRQILWTYWSSQQNFAAFCSPLLWANVPNCIIETNAQECALIAQEEIRRLDQIINNGKSRIKRLLKKGWITENERGNLQETHGVPRQIIETLIKLMAA